MALANTATSYGALSRLLHWLTALVVLTAIPLGLAANRLTFSTDAEVARAFLLFSLHKTVGVTALALGLARLALALASPRPVPLHPGRRIETGIARLVHWTLTLALIAVPLSGWITHAAEPGLAPIRWPFGQGLPFVAADATLAELAAAIHRTGTKLLAAALVLHVAGALKHALADRDGTLARMWRGTPAGDASAPTGGPVPPLAAVALWCLALGFGAIVGLRSAAELRSIPAEWQVAEWSLTLVQDGTPLSSIPAGNVSFRLSRSDTGSLDIFAALDSADDPRAAPFVAALPLPIFQFTGQVSGSPPTLAVDGSVDLAGATAPARFTVILVPDGARIFGTAPLPEIPGLGLTLEAKATRP